MVEREWKVGDLVGMEFLWRIGERGGDCARKGPLFERIGLRGLWNSEINVFRA